MLNFWSSFFPQPVLFRLNKMPFLAAPKKCIKEPADIVFVLDRSSSVGQENMTKALNAIANVLDEVTVGPADTVSFF